MSTESEYASYNWEGDEKWNVYQLNLIIPHQENTLSHAQALEKIKRKYYQRNVDPHFEATPNTPSKSAPNNDFSQGPAKFPDVSSPFDPKPPPSSSSSSSSPSSSSSSSSSSSPSYSRTPQPPFSSSPPTQATHQSRNALPSSSSWLDALSVYVKQLALSSPVTFIRTKAAPFLPRIWFAANVMLLMNSIFYLIWGAAYYYSALSAASCVYLCSLFMGATFSADSHFLRRVYSSENFSFFIFTVAFSVYQPIIAILIMVFIPSLIHTSDFIMQQRMISHPLFFSFYEKINQYRRSLIQCCSSLKFAVLLHLIVDLLFGRGNLVLVVGYTSFLVLDLYRSLPRGQLVAGLDQAVSQPSCPSFVRPSYHQIRPYLVRTFG
uniref:Uncharacterized protein n=1 Tax=Paramoeba aestuarina TaxID=180227 RepID=A0A7S4L4J3_9EUKA|mmetsp:Transcript_31118/g.48526  ORF Transcript_31118/g.48526 Transcript_31118/m.48526 type:complete len:378 (+) Transcript_31118:55-1188(+)